jgi:hypothetical protein
MGKVIFKMILWIAATVFILGAPLNSTVFAYGGGEGGGAVSTESSSGSPGGPPSGWEEENIDPEFQTPDFVKNPPEKKRDPWGLKKKPGHWTNEQWSNYKKKQALIFQQQSKEANAEKENAEQNYTIAKGTGYVTAGAGAVVGVIAAPAVAPTILVISIVGDGAATTAGSLAEGKDIGESVKDGVKKSVSSAILSKVTTGKNAADALIGFAGGQGYDHMNSSGNEPSNQMPPPDFTTSGGHGIYK